MKEKKALCKSGPGWAGLVLMKEKSTLQEQSRLGRVCPEEKNSL